MRRVSFALGLAIGVVFALAPASASGAVTGLEEVTANSPSNSSNAKGVTATCSGGKRLVGTGATISTSVLAETVLDDLTPSAALDGVTAFGVEDGTGRIDNWFAIARGMCAAPLPGLQLVTATSPTTSSSKGVTATCPAGKRVVGAGADLAGGVGQVELDDVAPNSALTSVSAFGAEDDDGQAASWTVRAHAVCADPVAGLERVAVTSAPTSGTSESERAPCPSGKNVLGSGWELIGGAGQVVVTQADPLPLVGSNPPNAVDVTAFEDEDGTGANWTLTGYAICANASQLVTAQSATDSEDKSVVAFCPAGKQPTGVGGDVSGGFGQVLLSQMRPEVSPPTGVASSTGLEDGTGTTDNWSVRSFAICSTPLPGLERIAQATSSNSIVIKTATATCPSGKQVVGAAAEITGGLGQVVLERVTPSSGLTQVDVRAIEDFDGIGSNWSLTAYAICAEPPPGLELVSATSEFDSEELQVATARCPAGKNLLGTGGELTAGLGRVLMDDLRPNAALTATTVTGFETEFGTPGEWTTTAYAICASP